MLNPIIGDDRKLKGKSKIAENEKDKQIIKDTRKEGFTEIRT